MTWGRLPRLPTFRHEKNPLTTHYGPARCLPITSNKNDIHIWPNVMIFHQPMFPWNKGVPFPETSPTNLGAQNLMFSVAMKFDQDPLDLTPPRAPVHPAWGDRSKVPTLQPAVSALRWLRCSVARIQDCLPFGTGSRFVHRWFSTWLDGNQKSHDPKHQEWMQQKPW